MNSGSTIFAQLMEHLPWHRFHKCVKHYRGNYKVKEFKCSDHFRVMAFAQLTFRESLRDIEACLRAMKSNLYHMGIRSSVSRNNLANANEHRDWRIYADFAQGLLQDAQKLCADEDLGVDLKATVYALDSTTIDLCLSLFPWARFKMTQGAIKLHTLLNLRGSIPEFIHISSGKKSDVSILDDLIPTPGAYYLLDRAYADFRRLNELHNLKAFFVTRARKNQALQRRYSHPVDRSAGLICDQTVLLRSPPAARAYPDVLRRIKYRDPEGGGVLVFLTNDFVQPALLITTLYKMRWQIELFFKWVKQHLRIKAFYGTSSNAVKVQVWIAIATYALIAIVRKRLNLQCTLYTLLQIFSVSIFEKTPILQALNECPLQTSEDPIHKQLNFSW